MDDAELEEFRAWKRAKDKTGFDEVFYLLEQSLLKPDGRQFSAMMPSVSYRLLATALMALKRRLVDE